LEVAAARVLTASGDDAAEAVADENDLFRTLQERFAQGLPKLARQVGTVRGSFRLIEAGTSLEEQQP
jgi:hypothetical protein